MINSLKKSPVSFSRGFTLYYAVLIGGVMLVIGASLLNLSLKEFLLSAVLRESEYAFYAADSGTECALYWDLSVNNTFPNYRAADGTYRVYIGVSRPEGQDAQADVNKTTPSITCNNATKASGMSIALSAIPATGSTVNATTTLTFNVGPSNEFCTVINVGKHIREKGTSNENILTIVDAYGYNLPCLGSPLALPGNARLVERAYLTQYPLEYSSE